MIQSQKNYGQLISINKLYNFAEKRGAMGKGNTPLKKKEKKKERKMKTKMKQKSTKIKGQTPDVTDPVKVRTFRFIVENACLCDVLVSCYANFTIITYFLDLINLTFMSF